MKCQKWRADQKKENPSVARRRRGPPKGPRGLNKQEMEEKKPNAKLGD